MRELIETHKPYPCCALNSRNLYLRYYKAHISEHGALPQVPHKSVWTAQGRMISCRKQESEARSRLWFEAERLGMGRRNSRPFFARSDPLRAATRPRDAPTLEGTHQWMWARREKPWLQSDCNREKEFAIAEEEEEEEDVSWVSLSLVVLYY